MIGSFITVFIAYFIVMDLVGNTPNFLAVTGEQDRVRKMRAAMEGTLVATIIMLFFALCGAWILAYLNIFEATFKIAGGIILFLVALEMLTANRQARKRVASTGNVTPDRYSARGRTAEDAGSNERDGDHDNVAIYPSSFR